MFQTIIEQYFKPTNIASIKPLAQAGSSRRYHRITLHDGRSFIACENDSVAENEAFAYFTQLFTSLSIPVPELLYMHPDHKVYILSDLGDTSLLDIVLQQHDPVQVTALYEAALTQLVNIQTLAGKQIDYSKCVGPKKFDRQAVISDLNYFKYYFLDIHEISYDKYLLLAEFEQFADLVCSNDEPWFMYRDFQGRNIMIHKGEPWFIDYQGGMQGPLQYDVASLLWQAKAALPLALKSELYLFYKNKLREKHNFEESAFDEKYYRILLLRLLQVMGAYGLRGLIQQKDHFVNSIPYGLQNISEWLKYFRPALSKFPILTSVLDQLVLPGIMDLYIKPSAVSDKKLTIVVQSFSYKKGLPADESGNGGGYMFDCRGILNPGRFTEYKQLTGRDQAVIDFLETKTRIATFLQHARQLVDLSVQDYLSRGFENLQISFGCTGGQHRSVYCADRMAAYLREKYPVQVELRHLIQDEKNWINTII